MVIVMVYLRRKRIQIFLYLDDSLLRGRYREEALSHIDTVLCLLDHLVLILNTGKSALVPTQKIEFIGS